MQRTDNSCDAVKAALASGEWREKKHPKSGRTYYVNVRTKVSVWNLAKELSCGASASPTAAQQQAQKWQAEEAQLTARVTALECERVRLESELSALGAPSASALRAEQSRLLDAARSLESAVADDLSARGAKAAELARLRRDIDALRLARQSERAAAGARRDRLAALRRERDEAAADLRRETAAGAALEAEAQRAEARAGGLAQEEARLAALLQRQTEAVAHARAELREVCAQRAEAQRRRERLEEENAAMEQSAVSAGEEEMMEEETSPVLTRLRRDAGILRREAEADAMEVETEMLNRAAETVTSDARRAVKWAKEMRVQLQVVRPLVNEAMRDMERVKNEMRGA